jgi:hypothetical protein
MGLEWDYRRPPDEIFSKALNRVRLWWMALELHPEFRKEFVEKVFSKVKFEFHKLDEETRQYFFNKYHVKFFETSDQSSHFMEWWMGSSGFGIPFDEIYETFVGGDPTTHPDWPERIHLVINPRLSVADIQSIVKHYRGKARAQLQLRRKNLKYHQYETALKMWSLRYQNGMSPPEIADQVFPEKGVEWQEQRIEELEKEGKGEDEIHSIIDEEMSTKEARVQRVNYWIEWASGFIEHGFKDLI